MITIEILASNVSYSGFESASLVSYARGAPAFLSCDLL